MCFHFMNTYVALCRCAGIKARTKATRSASVRSSERSLPTSILGSQACGRLQEVSFRKEKAKCTSTVSGSRPT
ncbi:MAG: hypothetical protein ACXV5I_08865 [Halobacteriota archaeon]